MLGFPEPPRKCRRVEKQSNSVRQLSSLPLVDALENILESGHLADVIFLVGGGGHGQRREIPAHKCILSARSEVFGAMVEERWNSLQPGENIARIEIDPKISPTAFEQLIKFIYKDNVASCLALLEFEDLFDFRILAEMYGFARVKEATSMTIALDIVEDYRKCFPTLELELMDEDLRNLAFAVLKRNLAQALEADNLPTKWTVEIWENVLTDESLSVEEIQLFRSLWRWREQDPVARNEAAQKLLKLVRFSLIDVPVLLAVVRPTHTLSIDDLWDVLHCKYDTTNPSLQNPRVGFNSARRLKKTVWVTNSKEIERVLAEIPATQDSEGGVEVILLPGEYYGEIRANKDFVTFRGFGPYTVLHGREFIFKISSNQTILSNVTLHCTMFILHATGNRNLIQNIYGTCINRMLGIAVAGSFNIFENFKFHSRVEREEPISFRRYIADKTYFWSLCGSEDIIVKRQGCFENGNGPPSRFLLCYGSRNKFSNFDCRFIFKDPNECIIQTQFIVRNTDNVIENVNFEGVTATFDSTLAPPCGARLCAYSSGLKVSKSCFAEVECEGTKHEFKEVMVRKTNRISGSRHKFENCKFGGVIDNGKHTVTKDCAIVPEWLSTVE